MCPSIIVEFQHRNWLALESRAKVVLLGGASLAGPTMAYWFATALFISLVAYTFLSRFSIATRSVVSLLLYLVACVRSAYFRDILFPFSADAAFLGIPFIHLGCTSRIYNFCTTKILIILALTCMLLVVTFQIFKYAPPTLDVKQGSFGVPVISFILAVLGISVVLLVSRLVDAFTPFLVINNFLTYLGKASLVIMLTHTAILTLLARLVPAMPVSAVLLACIIVPLVIYQILRNYRLLRLVLIGETAS